MTDSTGGTPTAQVGRREFLFLQGNASPFMSRVASGVARSGAGVHRIVFATGDLLFWSLPGAVAYRQPFRRWGAFFRAFVEQRKITDIVMFGDCRPYHRVAMGIARNCGIAVHVLEEGYLRPDWVTLEAGGTNALSSFPRDPKVIRAEAEGLPLPPRERVSGGFGARARWDVINHCMTVSTAWLFPNYVRHRPYHPVRELLGWAGKLLRRYTKDRGAVDETLSWLEPEGRVFLFPLQLDADYQVRRYYEARSVGNAIRTVMASFAEHARPDDRLLMKVHPLDNGLHDWRGLVESLATRLGLDDRVRIVDGGDLARFIQRSSGVIVVNSTTGITALHHRRPVIALGHAIYDMPGLTHQGSLDEFWSKPAMPDAALFADFFALLMWRTQVNGSFFTRRGIEIGVEGVLRRLGVWAPAPATQPVVADAPYPGVAVEHE